MFTEGVLLGFHYKWVYKSKFSNIGSAQQKVLILSMIIVYELQMQYMTYSLHRIQIPSSLPPQKLLHSCIMHVWPGESMVLIQVLNIWVEDVLHQLPWWWNWGPWRKKRKDFFFFFKETTLIWQTVAIVWLHSRIIGTLKKGKKYLENKH